MLAAAGTTLAHHAFTAEFDATKPVTLEGTVEKLEWLNPNVWLWIDGTNPDGTVDQWGLRAVGATRFDSQRARGLRPAARDGKNRTDSSASTNDRRQTDRKSLSRNTPASPAWSDDVPP